MKTSEKKSHIGIVWAMFAVYFVLFAFLCIASSDNTQLAWVLLDIWALVADIVLLAKNKFPSGKKIAASAVITAVFAASCIPRFGIYQIFKIILVFLM